MIKIVNIILKEEDIQDLNKLDNIFFNFTEQEKEKFEMFLKGYKIGLISK